MREHRDEWGHALSHTYIHMRVVLFCVSQQDEWKYIYICIVLWCSYTYIYSYMCLAENLFRKWISTIVCICTPYVVIDKSISIAEWICLSIILSIDVSFKEILAHFECTCFCVWYHFKKNVNQKYYWRYFKIFVDFLNITRKLKTN